MAELFVRSTGGSNANDGTTWATAKATLAGAAALSPGAGDTIYVADDHSEATGSAVTISLASGSYSGPVRIVAVAAGVYPVAAPAAKPWIRTTGSNTLSFQGCIYMEGLHLQGLSGTAATSAVSLGSSLASSVITCVDCEFTCGSTGAGARFVTGVSGAVNPGSITLVRPTYNFGSAGQRITVNAGKIRFQDLRIGLSSPTPSVLFTCGAQRGMDLELRGGDLSGGISGMTFFSDDVLTTGECKVFGVRMPASWSGILNGTLQSAPGFRVECHACYSDDGMMYEALLDPFGTAKSVFAAAAGGASLRTGGRTVKNSASAFSDPQPMSIQLGTYFKLAVYPLSPFVYQLESIWNEVVGSPITITVPIFYDHTSELTDAEVGMRVEYPIDSGSVRYGFADTMPATVRTAPQSLLTKYGASSGWDTSQATNPKQRQLQVTITPREVGWINVAAVKFGDGVGAFDARPVCFDAPIVS